MNRQREMIDNHPATAVVVNDDPTQLKVLAGLLRKEGIDAAAFESAEAALAEMNPASPPGLIVTDLYMPGIDGWRFCRLLRSPEYESFNVVPILLVSATYAGDEASRIAADLGANAFLPSPVDGCRLIDTVRAICAGEKPKDRSWVLVVEDSRTLAGLLGRRFGAHGYQADVAYTIREASRRLADVKYDIAVLDYHLPDGLGDALLPQFRVKNPNCICVMMTTDPDPKLALDWMKAGSAAYLRKPFDPEYLIEQCMQARRERALLRVEDLLEKRTRELRQSEAYYRTLFESVNDAILVHEIDDQGQPGKFIAANPEACARLGYAREELLSLGPQDIAPEDAYQGLAEVRQKIAATGIARFDTAHVARDGRLIPVESQVRTFKLDGKCLALSIARDQTDRLRTETLLRKKSEERRLLLDTFDTQVWYLANIDTYGAVNRAHADFLGLPTRDIAHKKLEDFVSKEVAGVCRDSNIEVFETGRPVQTEEWLPDAAGRPRLIQITKTPKLDEQGRVEFVVCAGTDITDLRLSEARFRRIFDDAPIGIELYDGNGCMTMLNPAAAEIFGLIDPSEVIGFPLFADPNIGEDNLAALARGRTVAYEALFDFEKVRQTDLYKTTRSGTIDVDVLIRPMSQNGEAAPQGYIVLIRDVSERNHLLRQLAQNEQQLRLIVENSTNLFYAHTPDHQLTYLSPRVKEILGYTLEEAMVKWTELATDHPVNAEGLAITERAIATGQSQPPYELELRHKSGRSVWIEIHEAPVVENGTTVTMVGSCTDVSARRQAEQKLHESEAKYRLLAENAKDVIWIRDMNLNPVFVSPSVEKVRGYTPEEATAQSIEDVLTASSARTAKDFLTGILEKRGRSEETASHYTIELEHKCKNGTTVWMESTVSWLYEQGAAPWGFLGVSRDITERRKFQEERMALELRRQQVQKAESLERMTGSIAHLFNNHLAAVIGNLELLADDLPPDASGSENLREAQTAAHRAAETSGLMLTFLGQSQGKPVLFDLAGVCRQRLARLEADMPMGAEIIYDLPDSGPVIRIDKSHLDQIVSILVTNAWESLDKAGEVRVLISTISAADIPDTHRFPLSWEPTSDSYACLAVTDTGCGMDDTTIGRIFDPFFTEKFTGRGLGLAVALGIVKASEGFITVETEPGRGSVFQVFWPLSSKAATLPGANKPVDPGPTESGGIILVVEDQEMVRKMTKSMLNRLGFEVLIAKDGKEAVELFSELYQNIRLVLTDLTMPQLNGRDTLKALRRIRQDIPVILASGYDENSALAEDQGEQPQAFLSKPYRMGDLKTALERALGDIMPVAEGNQGEWQ